MDFLLFRSAQGQTTPEEEDMVTAWRRVSPENEAAWQQLARLLALTTQAYRPPDAGDPPDGAMLIRRTEARPLLAPVVASEGAERIGRRTGRWAGLVAAVAAMLVVSVGVYRFSRQPAGAPRFAVAEIVTGHSEVATVNLRDGSVVRLAPQSKLRLTGAGVERVMWLEGRGYFAVAKQPGKPFTVRTRSGDAVALGTRFEIHATDRDLRLVVEEGRVALAVAGREVKVGAGQMSTVVDGAVSRAIDVSDSKSLLSWMGNFLVFQATPLGRVAAELERHYGARVTLTGVGVREHEVTATLNDKTLDEVVRIVCTVVGAQCDVHGVDVRIRL
jgi:transmembrane sensor